MSDRNEKGQFVKKESPESSAETQNEVAEESVKRVKKTIRFQKFGRKY